MSLSDENQSQAPTTSQSAQNYTVSPKSHQLYNVIMGSGIAEVLNNGDETTKPIVMYASHILGEAIRNNDIEYAKEIVGKVNGERIWYAMLNAVGLGHLDMAKMLIAKLPQAINASTFEPPACTFDYSVLLRKAYRSRNAEMQNYILQLAKDACYIRKDSAFKESFALGMLMINIRNFKLSHGNDAHAYFMYSDAIWSADKPIIIAALNILYGNDRKISDNDKKMILQEACDGNNIEIIEHVMSECNIDPSYFNEVIDTSLDMNNETLNFLLNYVDFDEEKMKKGIIIMIILRSRSLEMVKTLMRHIDITKYLHYVYREDIFNEIKDRLDESQRSIIEFRIACKLGRYDDVNMLIDKMDLDNIKNSFSSACKSGCIKTVRRMFWCVYDHDKINSSLIYDMLSVGNEEMAQFAIEQIRNQMLS
jgi:hypothetical protein